MNTYVLHGQDTDYWHPGLVPNTNPQLHEHELHGQGDGTQSPVHNTRRCWPLAPWTLATRTTNMICMGRMLSPITLFLTLAHSSKNISCMGRMQAPVTLMLTLAPSSMNIPCKGRMLAFQAWFLYTLALTPWTYHAWAGWWDFKLVSLYPGPQLHVLHGQDADTSICFLHGSGRKIILSINVTSKSRVFNEYSTCMLYLLYKAIDSFKTQNAIKL